MENLMRRPSAALSLMIAIVMTAVVMWTFPPLLLPLLVIALEE
jgi:hypothetical protein